MSSSRWEFILLAIHLASHLLDEMPQTELMWSTLVWGVIGTSHRTREPKKYLAAPPTSDLKMWQLHEDTKEVLKDSRCWASRFHRIYRRVLANARLLRKSNIQRLHQPSYDPSPASRGAQLKGQRRAKGSVPVLLGNHAYLRH